MSFVVTGVVLLLALSTGVISFVATQYVKSGRNVSSDYKAEDDLHPVTAVTSFFQESNRKQWALIIVSSVFCMIPTYQLHNTGMSAIDICKYSVVSLILQAVMIIDWKTHLIPNKLIAAFLGIGTILLAVEFVLYRGIALQTLLLSAVGFLCCLVLFYILSRLTRDGISMGDVKLIAAMGWVLGVSTTFFAVFFAMLICTIVAMFLLVSKKKNKNDRIPFGPFMFFGYISMLILFRL